MFDRTHHGRHPWRLKADTTNKQNQQYALRRELSFAARTPIPMPPADSDEDEEKPEPSKPPKGAQEDSLFSLVPLGLL